MLWYDFDITDWIGFTANEWYAGVAAAPTRARAETISGVGFGFGFD